MRIDSCDSQQVGSRSATRSASFQQVQRREAYLQRDFETGRLVATAKVDNVRTP